MESSVLFIGDAGEYWPTRLTEVLRPLGKLDVSTIEAWPSRSGETYSLIILDASSMTDLPSFIRRVLVRQPNAKVVVLSATSDWELGREAFQAGAIDFIPKSSTDRELWTAFHTALLVHLPLKRLPHR